MGVTVDLNFGIGVAQVVQVSDASGDKLDGFENLIGTAKNDILRGTSDTNNIFGVAGDDIIEGRGMNGLRHPSSCSTAAAGNDTASYQSSAARRHRRPELAGNQDLADRRRCRGRQAPGL